MTTSGTTAFDPNNLEIIEEAFDLAGVEARTGNDFLSAIRSLNIIHQEWANEGLNLWTLEEASIPLVAGTIEYSLPVDTIDILSHQIRYGSGSSQFDYNLKRVGFSKYARLTSKTQTGRPTEIFVDRQIAPIVRLWPVPQDSLGTLVVWKLRRIEDVGGGAMTQDVPSRFLPALITGLAIKIAIKKGKLDRLAILEPIYMKQLKDAKDEDRDRASFFVKPRIR